MNINDGPACKVFGSPPENAKTAGDDHEAGHNGNGGVENLYIARRVLNRRFFLHIRAERNKDAHGDRQRIEHLSHGGNDRHPGEILKIRHKEILNALQCAGTCDGIDCDDDRQYDKDRHHEFRYTLNTVAHAGKNDGQRDECKNDKANFGRTRRPR